MEGGDPNRDLKMVKQIWRDMYKTCGGEGTEWQAIQECLQKCKIACGEDATKPLYAWSLDTLTRLVIERGKPKRGEMINLIKIIGDMLSPNIIQIEGNFI